MTEVTTLKLLDRLIGFPTVSSASNLALIGWAEEYLRGLGFRCFRITGKTPENAGIFASVGPEGPGGVLLSAHSDVVPVDGQTWTRPPFSLTQVGGRLYGRGTTDMKGFLASALAAAAQAARRPLREPFKLAISYDEEVGCLGIRQMVGQLATTVGLPRLCIVGEPTGLRVATGHQGKVALTARFTGVTGHSAMAPDYLNALHLAADFVQALRAEQDRLTAEGAQDRDYDIPWSTLHVGKLGGGRALNIVPDQAQAEFELRHLAADHPEEILARLQARCAQIVGPLRLRFPTAAIRFEQVNAYPGLDTAPGHPAVAEVMALAGGAATTKVGYGTEAGFFAGLGIPTLVCGPGSMDQGHKPDEFIEVRQLAACDAMLARLVQSLAS